ncbi:Msb1p [Kluyveromyces lactis]|uniref:KLLA0C05258p n=1 Tax=Kluyveromyces lactis (strain ATCC 8585 / CBS 2359 / DSM 70799 / NBRC 1267 / NRRL Y-1140 / WM37) TaxID=284590 RepID=Q6CUF4_KLULA|nr:uncharacterized protein KLLA0_C05258g [Kluyveromyces lactis]CAH01286.1 KLLA0C05258p [Kluyveromyces lactis]|eukprot:XP_452435.1 uncharacterized protein KLLA0_C05258g [Kluyveromyces lactis]
MSEKKPLPQPPFEENTCNYTKEDVRLGKKTKRDGDDADDEFEFFHEFQREKVRSLIHLITNELKLNGFETEYLFLPFRPEQTNEKLLSFLNSIFPLGNGQPVADEKIQKILNRTEVWTLFQALKYIWCRLPNGEIIGWAAYNEFKTKEAEQNYSQKSFLEIMPKCLDSPNHASIVYDFFDLIVTMASNSKKNKMSARKISKMCAVWAFQMDQDTATNMIFDARRADTNDYKQGLSQWIPAAEAMFHLLLAFIRSFVPTDSTKVKLPKSLRNILFDNAYPPKNSDTFTSETILTVPIVTLMTTKFTRKPWQLIERCNELMDFDEPEKFETREDFALLKSLFKKKKNIEGISSKMSKESKRLMKCMSTKHSTFQAGWSKGRNLPSSNPDLIEESISISRVDIDDYFIWAWLSTLSYEQTSQKRKMFGRSLILEFEFDGFKKWLILEECDAVFESKAYNCVDRTDYINTAVSDTPKDEFLQQTTKGEAKETSRVPKDSAEPVQMSSQSPTPSSVPSLDKTMLPEKEIRTKPLPVPGLIDNVVSKTDQTSVRRPSPLRTQASVPRAGDSENPLNHEISPSHDKIASVQPRISKSPQLINKPFIEDTTFAERRTESPRPSASPQLDYQKQQHRQQQHRQQQDPSPEQVLQTEQKHVPLFTSPYRKSPSEKAGSLSNYGHYEPQYRKLSPSPTPLARSQAQDASECVRLSSSTYDELTIRGLPVHTDREKSSVTPDSVVKNYSIDDTLPVDSQERIEVEQQVSAKGLGLDETDSKNRISDLANLVDDMTLEMITADPGDAVKDLDASLRTSDEKFETLTMFDKYKSRAQHNQRPEDPLNDSQISIVTPLDISTNSMIPTEANDDVTTIPSESKIRGKDLPVVPLVVTENTTSNASSEELPKQTPTPRMQPMIAQSALPTSTREQRMTGSPSTPPIRQSDNPYQRTYPPAARQPLINEGSETNVKSSQNHQRGALPANYESQVRTLAPQTSSGSALPVIARLDPSPERYQSQGTPERYQQNYAENYSNTVESGPNYSLKQYTPPEADQQFKQHQLPPTQPGGHPSEHGRTHFKAQYPQSQPNHQHPYQNANYNGPAYNSSAGFNPPNVQQATYETIAESGDFSSVSQREQYRREGEPRIPQSLPHLEVEGQNSFSNARAPFSPHSNSNMNPHMSAPIDETPTPLGVNDREMRGRIPRHLAQPNLYSRQHGAPRQVSPDYDARTMHPGTMHPGPNAHIPQGTSYGMHQHMPQGKVPVRGPPNGMLQGTVNPQYGVGYGPQRYAPSSAVPPPQTYSSPPPPMQPQQFRPPVNGGRYNQHQSPVPPQPGFIPQGPVTNKLHSGNMDKQTNRKKLYEDIRSGNFGI